jgi:hypothetical protein
MRIPETRLPINLPIMLQETPAGKSKKFCEDLTGYLAVTVICVSDSTSRKKTLISMRIGGLQDTI